MEKIPIRNILLKIAKGLNKIPYLIQCHISEALQEFLQHALVLRQHKFVISNKFVIQGQNLLGQQSKFRILACSRFQLKQMCNILDEQSKTYVIHNLSKDCFQPPSTVFLRQPSNLPFKDWERHYVFKEICSQYLK